MGTRKASKSGKERRRFNRFTLKADVSFRILKLPSPGRMLNLLNAMRKGKTRDISGGGICFHTSCLLLPGTIIRLNIPSSPIGKAASRRARVVWTREVRPGDFRVGVRFT